MRIAYIGPEGRNSILQGWASPGGSVETRSTNFNGAIESSYDEYLDSRCASSSPAPASHILS